jgi:phosphoribosylglycinamide formyltransferase-1
MDNRKLAILLSGRGSNFLAIHEAIVRGDLKAEICCVVSNVPDAPGLRSAGELGLTSILLPSSGVERREYDRQLVKALAPFQPNLVCLAGFMRILTAEFLNKYPRKVLNMHPALLPSFPGLHAQRQALEHGVKITGCTVHFADEGVDTGQIIMQRAVDVAEGDTEESLSARILQQEHQIYWRAIALTLDQIQKNQKISPKVKIYSF